VKAAFLCLAHALVIAIAQVNGDRKYALYRQGKCTKKPVEVPLKASGVDLSNGGSFKEHKQFQEYLSDYKIVVINGLNTDRLMFSGNSLSGRKFYFLYNADTKHYSVITNIKAAMAKAYNCKACDTFCGFTHKCDKACSLCTTTPPYTKDETKFCGTYNRWFLSEKCFQNHLVLKVKGKVVCQCRQSMPKL